jgi:DNA-binding FadR family transcriptional regulator
MSVRQLLSQKELAAALGVSRETIRRAQKRGFAMPGRRATVEEYRAWHRNAAKCGMALPVR